MKQVLSAVFALLLLLGCAVPIPQIPEGEADTKEPDPMPYDNVYPQHEPYGTGVGAMPGRVVWAHDPDSVTWDGGG